MGKEAKDERRADYPHLLDLATRWRDNDAYAHVNNAVYYEYFDTIINRYLIGEGGLDLGKSEAIGLCVESHCNYLESIAFPDALQAGLRVGKLGSSSVRYEVAIFHADRQAPSALGHFVHVFVDRQTQRPTPIAGRMRDALARLLVAR